ncbi:glycosyltransferase family 2 protein [Candidatus Syntrophocurvum alkaliphilum]|uniref:glycosyltransferase family 2 protein n=1 Tax=Candidatus Syntrophocurvum alkaliphilum TaxID=2293317 RepID=UPI0018CE257A|nr:glycosyltransferase family 2 protein [Candidatus Syntrophocurvum alkaliphilum]
MFKKDAYDKAGNYDSRFENVEDYEFWMRLLEVGDKVFIEEILMEYRINNEYSVTYKNKEEKISMKSAYASVYHRKKCGDIPKVSVIIPAYNVSKFITNTIYSVLNQTYTNFHLIIIDDASTDNTWTKINAVYDSRIIPVHLTLNRGKVECLNIGLQYALGQYVMELDGDDWVEPDTLEVLVKEMDKLANNFALAYGNRKIWIDKEGILHEGPIYKGIQYKDKYEMLALMQTHCPRFFRKEALDYIGGWPKDIIENERLLPDDYAVMVSLIDKFDFIWIDKLFYNQIRHNKNVTHHYAQECNHQLEEIVKKTLQMWGNHYKPIFHYDSIWISKVDLIPTNMDEDDR